jgi:energy-coupling factor transport system permease protein
LLIRLAICCYVFFVVTLFLVRDIYVHVLTGAAILFVSLLKLPPNKLKSGLLPIFLFLLFTFAGNLFFHPGRIIFSHGFFTVTDEGLSLAGARTLRVFSMIFAAKLLTGTLSFDRLLLSFEGLMKPLEKIGIPVADFFSIMGLTLKSFPALMMYLLKKYREDMTNSGNPGIAGRMRHMAAFLMPVFVKSMRSPEEFFSALDQPRAPEEKG